MNAPSPRKRPRKNAQAAPSETVTPADDNTATVDTSGAGAPFIPENVDGVLGAAGCGPDVTPGYMFADLDFGPGAELLYMDV